MKMTFELKIKKKYLFFREDAKTLAESIWKKNEKDKLKNVFFNFSNIEFMSRSFIDEFLNKIEELEGKGIKVQLIHLKSPLNNFINYIKKTKNKIRKALAVNSE